MSQLDLSIAYNHLLGLILLFYIFLHCVVILLINYWYNNKLSNSDQEESSSVESIGEFNVLSSLLSL